MDYMEDLSGFQFSQKKLNKPVPILNMTCVTLPSRGNKIKGHAISGLFQNHWGSFNYPYICNRKEGKCRNKHHPKQELNQGPPDLKSSTLPNELKKYPTKAVLVVVPRGVQQNGCTQTLAYRTITLTSFSIVQ